MTLTAQFLSRKLRLHPKHLFFISFILAALNIISPLALSTASVVYLRRRVTWSTTGSFDGATVSAPARIMLLIVELTGDLEMSKPT